MIPDPFKRTVRIDVRVERGRVVRSDGQPQPEIQEGICGELTIPAFAIKDRIEAEALTKQQEQPFLQNGEVVVLGLSFPKGFAKPHALLEPQGGCLDYRYVYAPVVLLADILIYRTGDKAPHLGQAKCKIPILDDLEGCSLNHAFTLLSERYETHRLSHTGNVFECGWVIRKERWIRLKDLRITLPPATETTSG